MGKTAILKEFSRKYKYKNYERRYNNTATTDFGQSRANRKRLA